MKGNSCAASPIILIGCSWLTERSEMFFSQQIFNKASHKFKWSTILNIFWWKTYWLDAMRSGFRPFRIDRSLFSRYLILRWHVTVRVGVVDVVGLGEMLSLVIWRVEAQFSKPNQNYHNFVLATFRQLGILLVLPSLMIGYKRKVMLLSSVTSYMCLNQLWVKFKWSCVSTCWDLNPQSPPLQLVLYTTELCVLFRLDLRRYVGNTLCIIITIGQ